MSILQTLGKCVDVLKMLLQSNFDERIDGCLFDSDELDKTDRNLEDHQDSEKKKEKLLKLLEERLQHILKCMIKLAMAKQSK